MNDHDFTAFYHRYAKPLYWYVLGMARNRETAEEVTARTWARAWQNRDSITTNRRAWIYQVATNEMRYEVWKNNHPAHGEAMTEDHEAVADPECMEQRLADRDEWNRAAHAALTLPQLMRNALELATRGLTLKESARKMRVPESTAGTRLFNARQKVRTLCLA